MSLRNCLLLLALPLALLAQKKPVTTEVATTVSVSSRGGVTWAPDGTKFIVDEKNTLSLYEVKSGKTQEIVELGKLEAAAVKTAAGPGYDWTNRHVAETTIQWFSDNRRLMVSAGGDLFVVDTSKRSFEALTQSAEAERDPKLSPDNRYVSFRRDYDLYVAAVESKAVTRLTSNGAETLMNGQLDWVYPEELYLDTAHWWAPDSGSIAYLQFDTSREPIYPQVSLLGQHGVAEPERYPKAGDPNADVRLGVVPVGGGETKWMDLGDTRDSLLARVVWEPSSREIFVERLPRVQNKLDLVAVNPATGAARVVLHEEDPQWLNVSGEPVFVGSGDRFLWQSERSGFNHIYLYGTDGKLIRQLTSGDWEVDTVAGVDKAGATVFYTSTEDNPTRRQVYSVKVDGSGKRRLSQTPGTHRVSLSPGGEYFLDDFSSLSTPPMSTLCRADGSELRVFHAADRKAVDEYEMLPIEIVPVKAADGTTLYASLLKPAGFDPARKYPAMVVVYGGPGVQQVTDSWRGLTMSQVMAHKGFVVWQLDNRGSTGRGHKFESVIWHHMGQKELEDQQEGIQFLVGQGFVDAARIGMYGWSYGGYMTVNTATRTTGLIKAAVAGAPVTDWRNYDTIYTERYMGLPAENEDGYKASSPARTDPKLGKTKLLILHNIEDDNVHFQNSVQLAAALERGDQLFQMVVYPQRSHGVGGALSKQLMDQITTFFEDNLK